MTIGGNIDRLHPDFLDRLSKWNDACGGIYHVYVGARSKEKQQSLRDQYEEYLDGPDDGDPGRPVMAAKVGPMARHLYGLAADVRPNPVPKKHMDLAPQFGLLMDVPGEPWHIYHADSRKLIESGKVQMISDAVQGASSGSKRTLRPGSRGDDVRRLQKFAMANFGTYADSIVKAGGADGAFGEGTRLWVVEFQRRCGLAADGIVGPDTWKRLVEFGF